jgi:hypothetical protein
MRMMTSGGFGHIAAEDRGYGRVELQQAIAQGAPEWCLVADLRPAPEAAAEEREYIKSAGISGES